MFPSKGKPMRYLYTLIILAVWPSFLYAEGAKDVHFQCSTDPLTASFVGSTDGDVVRLSMINFKGAESLPIFEGVVTAGAIDFLQKKRKVIERMGDKFYVEFERKNCKEHEEGVFSCESEKAVKIGALQVDGFRFNTRKKSTKSYGYTFDAFEVIFSVLVNNQLYNLPMSYDQSECRFDQPKKL